MVSESEQDALATGVASSTSRTGPSEERFSEIGAEPFSLIDTASRLVVAFTLYVLSIGPMYWTWYEAKHVNGSWFVRVLYEPLYLLAGLIPLLGRWINWYICWWIY